MPGPGVFTRADGVTVDAAGNVVSGPVSGLTQQDMVTPPPNELLGGQESIPQPPGAPPVPGLPGAADQISAETQRAGLGAMAEDARQGAVLDEQGDRTVANSTGMMQVVDQLGNISMRRGVLPESPPGEPMASMEVETERHADIPPEMRAAQALQLDDWERAQRAKGELEQAHGEAAGAIWEAATRHLADTAEQYGDTAEHDYDTMRQDFSRLRSTLDDIRSQRIDPFRLFRQDPTGISAIASAIAIGGEMLTSQWLQSAGGQPLDTVKGMIDGLVNQDLQVQQANIDNQFRAYELELRSTGMEHEAKQQRQQAMLNMRAMYNEGVAAHLEAYNARHTGSAAKASIEILIEEYRLRSIDAQIQSVANRVVLKNKVKLKVPQSQLGAMMGASPQTPTAATQPAAPAPIPAGTPGGAATPLVSTPQAAQNAPRAAQTASRGGSLAGGSRPQAQPPAAAQQQVSGVQAPQVGQRVSEAELRAGAESRYRGWGRNPETGTISRVRSGSGEIVPADEVQAMTQAAHASRQRAVGHGRMLPIPGWSLANSGMSAVERGRYSGIRAALDLIPEMERSFDGVMRLVPGSEERNRAQSRHSSLFSEFRQIVGTGANLTEKEIELILAQLPDPTSLWQAVTNWNPTEKLRTSERHLQRLFSNLGDDYGWEYRLTPAGGDAMDAALQQAGAEEGL